MNPRTFLGRLAHDKRGNTIAMMAISLIPISALVGSAIDTSRMYFVKVRLQQACDSGALAGRKFMSGTTYDTTANTRANTFFDNNFRVGVFGTTSGTRTFSKTADNQVQGTASAVVPMTLTRMMGATDATLTVTCQAKLEVPNLDVMFVLDTTGSMGDTNPGDSVSKISALRTSVLNFFDALEAAKAGTSRIRYGFMPYSSTVNVGLLLKREWMVDSWTYQSRTPADVTTNTSTTTQGTYNTTSSSTVISGSKTNYTTYGNPEDCQAPANTYTSSSSSTTWTSNGDGSESQTVTKTENGSTFSALPGTGVCTITETRYTNYKTQTVNTRRPNPNAGQTTTTTSNVYWWNYQPVSYDVSGFKGSATSGLMAGGTVRYPQLAGGNGSAWSARDVPWNSNNACIEERDTVRQSDYSTIPSTAYDLDIDSLPEVGNPATQWRPWLRDLVYARKYTSYTNPSTTNTTGWPSDRLAAVRYNGNYINLSSFTNDYAACPTQAKKLNTITKAALTTYLNSLRVAGRTYHDVGFVWGLRFLSPDGLYASENQTAPNGSAIARHVIFMTDGQTETNFADYDAYGLAALDRRRTDPSRLPMGATEQNTIVENRLTALCQAAQRKNMTVWVIAFGTTLTPLLSNCATPGGHAYQANNADELNTAFATIASNIAKLRVSQ
ncbi:TadE/TadG family type IV pilus assembly protein [Sphingomonas sp.]|uniref:TadE/TadG family type IV pilus assembly protein n=1 Tax=Sphingomonas sp. TaxID=28214 RepID=UPI003B00A287